jgi:hypothetical protein
MESSVKRRDGITALSVVAGLLVVATVTVLWLGASSAPWNLAAALGTVSIFMEPESQTVDPGVPFQVNVRIDPQGLGVVAADVFINFDPQYLSVVEIVDGDGLQIFVKPYNNATGRIDIGAGTLGTPVAIPFTLVTLRLQGKIGTGSTPTELAFAFAPGENRETVVKDASQNILGAHTNGYVYITGSTPTSPPGTPTRTPTPTRTTTPTQTNTPTITATPQGTPNTIEFQNGRSPDLSYSGAEDTYLDAWDPNKNWGEIGEMRLRQDGAWRPLVKFDLSQHLPFGSTIVEARMYLWLYRAIPNAVVTYADLHQVNRHWDELSATWNHPWQVQGGDGIPGDRAAASAASAELRPPDTIGAWAQWDVTDLVRNWVSGTSANEGVLVLERPEPNREVRFRSCDFTDKTQRPKLWVKYYPAPPTPTPTHTATATPTYTSTPVPGRIEGLVWNDVNGNAVPDAGEPGLAGATLRLYDYDHPAPEPPIRPPVVTGSNGTFDFADLAPGMYILVVQHPGGYVPTTVITLTVVVSPGGAAQPSFGAWIPSLTPSPSPTGTILKPYKVLLPIIIHRG